jgi:hypothetical protein
MPMSAVRVAATWTWEVLGMLDYRYNSWLMLHVGYRHMHIDYTGSALQLGVALSGRRDVPILIGHRGARPAATATVIAGERELHCWSSL